MSAQTEMQQTPKRHSTMPTSPRTEKRPGFFRRHLTSHHRKDNSITKFPDAPPPAPSSPEAPVHSSKGPAIRRTSVTSRKGSTGPTSAEAPRKTSPDADEETGGMITLNGSVLSDEELTRTSTKDSRTSRTGLKWAIEGSQGLRPRRPSSPSQRRPSIYKRVDSGGFAEGVDAGVGTKARQLSVHIPDEKLEVDECPLEDHFSLFSRMGKKNIGEGGAAIVQLMKSTSVGPANDKLFAVKEFRPREVDNEAEAEYQRKIKSEYAIAKSCEHPNIVKTYRLCYAEKRSTWYHVMEYCDQGDLNDLVNLDFFTREDRDCVFKQLLRGVDFLHSRGIAHRDLKSENLLISKTGCLKIADFGTSEVFTGAHPGLRHCRRPSLVRPDATIRYCRPGLVGSRPYMAPEILQREHDYDPRAVDVWACAVVYLTLVVGGTPWPTASRDINNFNIYCCSWERFQATYGDELLLPTRPLPDFSASKQFRELGAPGCKRLVFGMLHPDPRVRWTVREALESKTVVEFPCCQQEGYSDDIRTRQRKALHHHVPPSKKARGLSAKAA